MNIAILGGAGFIGTNLALFLAKDSRNTITVIDRCELYFENLKQSGFSNIQFRTTSFDCSTDFDSLIHDQECVYHLCSSTIPGNSNVDILEEIQPDLVLSTLLFDACVREHVKRVVFISSGGAVYGNTPHDVISENCVIRPITSYGVQKATTEMLLRLYNYRHQLDYRIVRLGNPYGPYQRPNGVLGVVTTFTYKALKNEELVVYGDGNVVRDFIYIDDAIRAIVMIANSTCAYHTFNLGSGIGHSINDVIEVVREVVNPDVQVRHIVSRATDVQCNILSMKRFESVFGSLHCRGIAEGVARTAQHLQEHLI